MRSPQFAGWIVLVTALTVPSVARSQITYSFTRIAVTSGTSPFSGVFAPSLNAAGTAAFGANLTAGGSGVFIGAGARRAPLPKRAPLSPASATPPAPSSQRSAPHRIP